MVVIKTALKEAPCNCYNCEYPKDTLTLCGERKHVCMLTGEELYNMDIKPDTCPLLEIDTGWINVDERLPEPMKKVLAVVRNDSLMYPPGTIHVAYYTGYKGIHNRKLFIDTYSHWQPFPLPPEEEVD